MAFLNKNIVSSTINNGFVKRNIFKVITVYLICVLLFAFINYIFLNDGTHFRGAKTFIDHLYFSSCTFCTLGYGDVAPVSQLARLWMCTYIIFVFFIFGHVLHRFL